MTAVKLPANNSSQDRNNTCSDLQNTNKDRLSVNAAGEFPGERKNYRILHGKLKGCDEIEMDLESTGSAEDMESPKSVVKVRKWPAKNVGVRMHSQILRIREEDSHLGEDIGDPFISAKDKVAGHDQVASHVDVFILSRPVLPASPLSGKTDFKMLQ